MVFHSDPEINIIKKTSSEEILAMETKRSFFGHPFLRFSFHASSHYRTFLVFVLTLAFIPSCVEKKMSLKEAKQIAVSMEGKSFVPPPRRIDDVRALLNQPGNYDPKAVARAKEAANIKPPKNKSSSKMGRFYVSRGISRGYLGWNKQALDDIRKGLKYWGEGKPSWIDPFDFSILLVSAGRIEMENGNFSQGIELIKKGNNYRDWPMSYLYLMEGYLLIGDFKAAKENMEKGLDFVTGKLTNPLHILIGMLNRYWENYRAGMLEAKGMFVEAEPHRRASRMWGPNFLRDIQSGGIPGGGDITIQLQAGEVISDGLLLAKNLTQQGRLVEAEMVARDTLKDSIGLCGKNSAYTGKTVGCLAAIRLTQGYMDDAEKLGHAQISILKASGLLPDSRLMGEAKTFLGDVLTVRRNFIGAMKHYDLAGEGLIDNQYYFKKILAQNPNRIISQLKTGRIEEAMESISGVYNHYKEFVGEENYTTAELLALKGMGLFMMKREKEALEDFSRAVPLLFNNDSGEKLDYTKKQGRQIIVESYLDLLKNIHESKRDKEFSINASREAFKIVGAMTMTESTVRGALGAFTARAAASRDPELAELVRKEQDLLRQSEAAHGMLANAMIVSADARRSEGIEDHKATIDRLMNSRMVLLEEIKTRFPQYSNFINPKPVTLNQVQKYLNPNEALISINTTENQTYVWAVPKNGKIQWAAVPFGKKDIQKTGTLLRKALDPKPETFGDIPEFDLDRAYDLYNKLLKPVEEGWKDARDLLIVAPGPLGQLPFSILPTESVRLGKKKRDLFANYRDVPWLIRKVSITRLPSISSFVTLRTIPEGDPSRKALAGFGDPLFNRSQLAKAAMEKDDRLPASSGQSIHVRVRGIRFTELGNLDNEKISSSNLGNLNRLPDTAEEIKGIANALGADPAKDIFLGKQASESQVKTMDLSDRRVIAFASHALVPGDLDGLDQPAIALSAPSVTGGNEDGLLTMGEVLKLRLNADWVVLSACNTGAADGAGAEAVSGLGRAFFYAGTRALLVSMWPVETISAKRLTTGLFQYQKQDRTITRARALQKSMLELIDNQVLKDDASGKIIASYAHPIFWAPFIVVGDGG